MNNIASGDAQEKSGDEQDRELITTRQKKEIYKIESRKEPATKCLKTR